MKEKRVIDYYLLCNRLKNVIRTGWKDWHVKKERVESVAEHIYGTQMLAIAMYSEYQYDIDIHKVILMLALHELEETVIGDITHLQMSKEEVEIIGHKAVEDICSNLLKGEQIKDLIFEFDKLETKEAKFAKFCDKLEADIQAKIYGDSNWVDLDNQEGNISLTNERVQQLLKDVHDFGKMWVLYGQERYHYDENFKAVSNYLLDNEIKDEE